MKVWRKGITADAWSDDFTSGGRISAKPGRIYFRSTLPAKGSKITEILARFDPSDWGNLIKAMGVADDAAALRAIGEYFAARTATATVKPPAAAAKPPVVGFQVTH